MSAWVVAVGLRTSIGVDAPMSAGAVSAGIARARTSPWVDRAGDEIVLCDCADLEGRRGLDRARALLRPALRECAAGLRSGPQVRLGLWLAVPSGGAALLEDAVGILSGRALRDRVRVTRSATLGHGHAAGFQGLSDALVALASGALDVAMVGGVDTWVDVDRLDALDLARRLHAPSMSEGFQPGEGAAFVLLARDRWLLRSRYAQVDTVGLAAESATLLKREEVCTGQGLTRAFWQVLDPLGARGERAELTVGDLNGEGYRAMEWTLAYTRTGRLQGHPLDLRTPASWWGDLGAASAPALLAFTAWLLGHREPDVARALVWGSSDEGLRGAVVLTRPDDPCPAPPVRLRRPAATRAFARSVWEEHLEDAAFFLEQREAQLQDPGFDWHHLETGERRLRAHLDALARQVDPALRTLEAAARTGNAWTWAAAVGALCLAGVEAHRLGRSLAGAKHRHGAPLRTLLRLGADPGGQLARLQGHRDPFVRAAAVFAGADGPLAPLLEACEDASARVVAEAVRALGRRPEPEARATLDLLWWRAHEPSLQRPLLVAGARQRHPEALRKLRSLVGEGTFGWDAPLLLALVGDAHDAALLAGPAPLTDTRRLRALGWLGAVASVPALLDALLDPGAGPAATVADVALRRMFGVVPPEGWRAWWGQRGPTWPDGTRLRGGEPWHAGAALQGLVAPRGGVQRRARLALELDLRQAGAAGVDVRSTVARQRRALGEERAGT